MRRESKTRRRLRARRWVVGQTVSRDFDLMTPIAKQRSAAMFVGPWPVRMVQRSSSQFQSRV
jgi:hypothetical protein